MYEFILVIKLIRLCLQLVAAQSVNDSALEALLKDEARPAENTPNEEESRIDAKRLNSKYKAWTPEIRFKNDTCIKSKKQLRKEITDGNELTCTATKHKRVSGTKCKKQRLSSLFPKESGKVGLIITTVHLETGPSKIPKLQTDDSWSETLPPLISDERKSETSRCEKQTYANKSKLRLIRCQLLPVRTKDDTEEKPKTYESYLNRNFSINEEEYVSANVTDIANNKIEQNDDDVGSTKLVEESQTIARETVDRHTALAEHENTFQTLFANSGHEYYWKFRSSVAEHAPVRNYDPERENNFGLTTLADEAIDGNNTLPVEEITFDALLTNLGHEDCELKHFLVKRDEGVIFESGETEHDDDEDDDLTKPAEESQSAKIGVIDGHTPLAEGESTFHTETLTNPKCEHCELRHACISGGEDEVIKNHETEQDNACCMMAFMEDNQPTEIAAIDDQSVLAEDEFAFETVFINPGYEYWKFKNPCVNEILVTDVMVGANTVTIRECVTKDGFFRESE